NMKAHLIPRGPRTRFIVSLLVLLGTMALFSSFVFAQTVPQSNPTVAHEIIAELNAWRVSQGLWPLAYNATLESLAMSQASYLMTTKIPKEGGDFHKD